MKSIELLRKWITLGAIGFMLIACQETHLDSDAKESSASGSNNDYPTSIRRQSDGKFTVFCASGLIRSGVRFEKIQAHRACRTQLAFYDDCIDKGGGGFAHTVDSLLKIAQTTDCLLAEERLGALTSLDLRRSEITDLSPLATLNNLTVLKLQRNQITSVQPLGELRALQMLWIDHNQIESLQGLKDLENLSIVSLNGNPLPPTKQACPIDARSIGLIRACKHWTGQEINP